MTSDVDQASIIQQRNNPSDCIVLLATHNGAKYLEKQVRSISAQKNVRIEIVVSDDNSSDQTIEIIEKLSQEMPIIILPRIRIPGSTCANFFRLMMDSEIRDAAYIALSDQDDIWLPHKLSRAISILEEKDSGAYSSNVEAFWPDDSVKLIEKSQKQVKWDHLFSSPGPGCTFVFRRDCYLDLKEWLISNQDQIDQIWMHDWFLYALTRCKRYKWHIDNKVSMKYRQHGINAVGANHGLTAWCNRLKQIQSGEYFNQVLLISRLLNVNEHWTQRLSRMNFIDRLYLIRCCNDFRRKNSDILFLILSMIIAPNPQRTISIKSADIP